MFPRGSEGSSQGELSTIQMQALTSHLEKLFDRKLEEIHKCMDQMGNQIVNRQTTPYNSRRDKQSNEEDESQFEEEDNEEEQPRRRKPNQIIKGDIEIEERMIMEELKLKSLHFKAKVILKHTWNQNFSCQIYLEGKKVKLAALEFIDYVLVWWDQMQRERVRYEERLVRTWEEMKAIIRRRFVLSYFHR
ncbi:hypothetical protein CR513_12107, partial [Mucuna pruriens]